VATTKSKKKEKERKKELFSQIFGIGCPFLPFWSVEGHLLRTSVK